MGRKRKKPQPQTDSSAFMRSLLASAEKQFGNDHLYIASEHEKRATGLPFPSLALEYLFRSNVLYLGSIYGLAGPPASFKSSLGLEFAKMLCKAGGGTALVETEGGKISPGIIKSIVGEYSDRLLMYLAEDIESAQERLSHFISWVQKQGKGQLFGLFLDSLFGSGGQETAEKLAKEGHAGRTFPVSALLWSQWFQVWAPKLVGWPIIMVFVNHQKRDIDSQVRSSYRHPGGDAQEFYATVYMHVRHIRTNDGATQRVSQLELRTVKHSFEPSGQRINIPFILDKSKTPATAYFDWNHATADLLADTSKCPHIQDILKVTTTNKSMTALTRRFSCKQLGLKEVSGSVLGEAIQQDAELLRQLRPILGIAEHEIWSGYMPDPTNTQQLNTSADTESSVEDSIDL